MLYAPSYYVDSMYNYILLLYYEIVTAPTFYVDYSDDWIEIILLYYKNVIVSTFYVCSSNNWHKNSSYIYNYATT